MEVVVVVAMEVVVIVVADTVTLSVTVGTFRGIGTAGMLEGGCGGRNMFDSFEAFRLLCELIPWLIPTGPV